MPHTDAFRDEFQQTFEGDHSNPGVEKREHSTIHFMRPNNFDDQSR